MLKRLICWLWMHDYRVGLRSEDILCGMCNGRTLQTCNTALCARCGYWDRAAVLRWIRHHQMMKHTSYLSRIHKLRQVTTKNGATRDEEATAARLLQRLQSQATQFEE